MLNEYNSNAASRSREGALQVVSIAHPAYVDGSGRLRYNAFANDPQLNVTLVIPDRWIEEGRSLPTGTVQTEIGIKTMKVMFPAIPKAKWYMHFYPEMSRMLDELRPDVLHLWEEPWSAVAGQAAYFCQRRGIALVLETDQNILRPLPFPFQQLRRYTLARTNLLIARQQEALDVSRAWGYTGPAAFVEYVVDTQCFKPVDKNRARQAFGIEGFTIGYVGRLIREKGLFTVLDAVKACRQPVNFVMMGSGIASGELAQRVKELGLEGRVRILNPEPQDRVAIFMNALDTLVLMSETTRTWKEQFGRVIIEAQACGVPVIGSSSGSIAHVTGAGGWIVKEQDAAALADLLDNLALNHRRVAEAGSRALENLKRFAPEVVSNSLRNAWLGAAQSKPQRRTASVG